MICDSHVHVWVQDTEHYPWQPVGGYVPETEAPVERLLKVMDETGVDGTVLVQPTPYGWDNSYLLDCAKQYPKRFRCVCLVDPLSSEGSNSLHILVNNKQAQGIRINWNLQPIHEWQSNSHHYLLWETAGHLNIPICLQLTPDYYNLLNDFAMLYPSVRIVVDHLGRPKQAADLTDPQFIQFLKLAQFPNIHVKLSGLYYYSGQIAPYQDVLPLIQAVCRQFSAQRCMWGSDFPFVEERWSYSALLNAVKTDWGLTTDELKWVLGETAFQLWWKTN